MAGIKLEPVGDPSDNPFNPPFAIGLDRASGPDQTVSVVKTKCQHCGQWGFPRTPCAYCGAPIDLGPEFELIEIHEFGRKDPILLKGIQRPAPSERPMRLWR